MLILPAGKCPSSASILIRYDSEGSIDRLYIYTSSLTLDRLHHPNFDKQIHSLVHR